MSQLPDPDQREGATAHSQAEIGRRDTEQALASGELTLQGLFNESDSERGYSDVHSGGGRIVGHMHIRRALLAMPHVGDIRADAILEAAGIDGQTHVDDIGVQQRQRLIDAVASYQPQE